MSFGRVVSRIIAVTLLTLPLLSCSGSPSDSVVLTAEVPLHLEEHIDAATVVGSEVQADVPAAVVWHFAEPQPEWKVLEPWEPEQTRPELSRTEDALRIALGAADVTDEDEDMGWGLSTSIYPTGSATTGPISRCAFGPRPTSIG